MKALEIPGTVLDAIIEACRQALPMEACGLLGGHEGKVASHYPLRNVAENPHNQFMGDARSHMLALDTMTARGEELVAVYHSHPATPAVPSRADIIEANYPDAYCVIVGLRMPERPEVRAFRLNPSVERAVEVRIVRASHGAFKRIVRPSLNAKKGEWARFS